MRILLLILWLSANICLAQSPILGRWKTVDEATGEEKSIIEIFERDGKVFGKIIRIFPPAGEDPDPVCDACPPGDSRYKKKIIGMEIIQNMQRAGQEYADGSVLDPEAGKVYRCRLWMEGAALKVRGYWGPLYRTQTWKRVN